MLKQGVALAMLVLISGISNATILSGRDLRTPGDALITYDSRMGLEWLDVPFTQGKTYNETAAMLNQEPDLGGFRFASLSDIDDLFVSADVIQVDPTNGHQNIGNSSQVSALISLLGCTLCVSPYEPIDYWNRYSQIYGITDNYTIQALSADLLTGATLTRRDQVMYGDYYFTYMGSFLVRDARSVPEPTTNSLFAAGLLVWFGTLLPKLGAMRKGHSRLIAFDSVSGWNRRIARASSSAVI